MASGLIGVWSYDPTVSIPRDQVRLLCGDTERTLPQLYDEELDWLLSKEANPYLCAANACEVIAAKLIKRPESIGLAGQHATISRRVEWYQQQANVLRAEAGRHGAAAEITVGALLVLESKALQAEAGVIPAFHRNQFGHPGNLT